MQPYLQAKRVASILVNDRKSDGSGEISPEGEPNHALNSAAEDLIRAVHAKDVKAVADAIEAAVFACSDCDDEGSSLEQDDG